MVESLSIRTLAAVSAALVLAGCDTVGGMVIGGHAADELRVDRSASFAAAYGNLPPLADGDMRLFVYRPQGFGGYPRPVVVMQGVPVGVIDQGIARSTRSPHRSAFVLDTPSAPIELWLFTIEETREQDMGRRIHVSPLAGRTFFIRFTGGFNYTSLEHVAESEAMKEMRDLTFTGHFRLVPRQ